MFFFFNDTATTEIYTLSLHDALPIWAPSVTVGAWFCGVPLQAVPLRVNDAGRGLLPVWAPLKPKLTEPPVGTLDRKSTRLNSSHANISYAVFCLKKKKI